MKLYKYKSLTSFNHFADIILNQRFYGASFKELNDPMEGLFYPKHGMCNKLVHDIEEHMGNHRVVSLSSDPTHVLLWAHYADSFRGVCIGVEIDDRLVEKIQYGLLPDKIDDSCRSRIEEVSKNALKKKLNAWSYESEYRALISGNYLRDNLNITEIRLGQRIEEPLKQAIITLVKDKCDIFETRLTQVENRGVVIPTANLIPATLPGI